MPLWKDPIFSDRFYIQEKDSESHETIMSLAEAKKALLSNIIGKVIKQSLVDIDADTLQISTAHVVNLCSKHYGISPSCHSISSKPLLALITSGSIQSEYATALKQFFTPYEFIKHYFDLMKANTVESKVEIIQQIRENYLNASYSSQIHVAINEETNLIFDTGFYWIETEGHFREFALEDFKAWRMPDTASTEFGIYYFIMSQCFKLNLKKEWTFEQNLNHFLKTIEAIPTIRKWLNILFPKELWLLKPVGLISNEMENELIKELSCQGTLLGFVTSHEKLIIALPLLIKEKLLNQNHFQNSPNLGSNKGKNPAWYIFNQLMYPNFEEKNAAFALISLLVMSNLLTREIFFARPIDSYSIYYLLNREIQDEYHRVTLNQKPLDIYVELVILIRILRDRFHYPTDEREILVSVIQNINSVKLIGNQYYMKWSAPLFFFLFKSEWYTSRHFSPNSVPLSQADVQTQTINSDIPAEDVEDATDSLGRPGFNG